MIKHFIDLETTSLDFSTGEICEIAIISVYKDGERKVYKQKIMPINLNNADPESLEINGFNVDDWEGSPTFSEVALDIAKILRKGIIIAHNVEFDYSFLKAEFLRLENSESILDNSYRISYRKFDTKFLVMEHLPLWSSSMRAVRKFFGWSSIGAHTALKDCEDCEQIYNKLYRATMFHRLYWSLKQRLIYAKRTK